MPPPLSFPRGRRSALRCRADGNVAWPTCSHAHRCSRLTHQHGSEQSGLVTLTFDLLTLKVVATSVPILVFLGLSVLNLGPMYATDRRQTDIRQHHRLMPPPITGGGIIIKNNNSNNNNSNTQATNYACEPGRQSCRT